MEIIEIMDAINGVDESKRAKASLVLSTAMFDVDEDKLIDEKVLSFYGPVVRLESRFDFIQVDIIFNSHVDVNLRSIWNMLESYGKHLSEYEDCDYKEPISTLNIVPLQCEGKYYAVAMNPLFWVLQPELPGKQPNMIRILFYKDNFLFYETDQIDINSIDAEVKREISTQEYMESVMEMKEQEREEYLAKRNEMIENNRKTTFR